MRTVVPVPRGGHLPFRTARLFLLRNSLEVFATPTRRYHGRMLIHPSPPACATPDMKRCLHRRTFGTLASPPPPVQRMPWGPHPPGHAVCESVDDPITLATLHIVGLRRDTKISRPYLCLYFTLSLTTSQIYMIKERCWCFQINFFI